MNACFYPGIIPDQSNEFYDAEKKFYEIKESFDVNDVESLTKLIKQKDVCVSLFDKNIFNGGINFIATYAKVAIALYKMVNGDGKLTSDEVELLKIQSGNPCYENFGGIDFQKYVNNHLFG